MTVFSLHVSSGLFSLSQFDHCTAVASGLGFSIVLGKLLCKLITVPGYLVITYWLH